MENDRNNFYNKIFYIKRNVKWTCGRLDKFSSNKIRYIIIDNKMQYFSYKIKLHLIRVCIWLYDDLT